MTSPNGKLVSFRIVSSNVHSVCVCFDDVLVHNTYSAVKQSFKSAVSRMCLHAQLPCQSFIGTLVMTGLKTGEDMPTDAVIRDR